MFAPWDEILAYLKHCATKYGIADKIRYGAEVTEAAFDEATGRWTVTINGDETLETQALVDRRRQPAPAEAPRPARPRHVHRQDVPLAAVGPRPRPDRPPGRRHRDRRLRDPVRPADRRAGRAPRPLPAHRTVDHPEAGPRDRRRANAPCTSASRPASARSATSSSGVWRPAALGLAGNPKLMKGLELQARRHLRKQVKDPVLRAQADPGLPDRLQADPPFERLLPGPRPRQRRPDHQPISRVTPTGVTTPTGSSTRATRSCSAPGSTCPAT